MRLPWLMLEPLSFSNYSCCWKVYQHVIQTHCSLCRKTLNDYNHWFYSASIHIAWQSEVKAFSCKWQITITIKLDKPIMMFHHKTWWWWDGMQWFLLLASQARTDNIFIRFVWALTCRQLWTVCNCCSRHHWETSQLFPQLLRLFVVQLCKIF